MSIAVNTTLPTVKQNRSRRLIEHTTCRLASVRAARKWWGDEVYCDRRGGNPLRLRGAGLPPGIPEAIAVEVGELVGLARRDGEDSKRNVPIYAGVGEQGFKERPR
jgi:hypothetical protein